MASNCLFLLVLSALNVWVASTPPAFDRKEYIRRITGCDSASLARRLDLAPQNARPLAALPSDSAPQTAGPLAAAPSRSRHPSFDQSNDVKPYEEFVKGNVAVYAAQGRKNKMEDRFFVEENINGKGVSLYGIFDGHTGAFAADYAKTKLMPNLRRKIGELQVNAEKKFARRFSNNSFPPSSTDIKEYTENLKADYAKLLHDVILSEDATLMAEARKLNTNSGSTALIALLDGPLLVVANVGDSRGVMCNSEGKAVPLSCDHKPNEANEKQRIMDAGGNVYFNGVWRVDCLALSRTLGNNRQKSKNLVTAVPDIRTFNLLEHKPQFLLLASDGLWDRLSNEQAVDFIKERINEEHFGAKSVIQNALVRGSRDNITVIVVKLKNSSFSSAAQKLTDASRLQSRALYEKILSERKSFLDRQTGRMNRLP